MDEQMDGWKVDLAGWLAAGWDRMGWVEGWVNYRNEILSNETSSRTRTFFLREKLGISSVCTSQMNVTQVRARSIA